MSVDPGLRPDDLSKPNTIFIRAQIELNYNKKFPEIEDGVCPKGSSKIIIYGSVPTAVCIPNERAIVFLTRDAI